jgi:hypothetical protein
VRACLQVVLTLLALKCLLPDSLHLTRGNHESKTMNKMYGFEGEVKHKYSEQARACTRRGTSHAQRRAVSFRLVASAAARDARVARAGAQRAGRRAALPSARARPRLRLCRRVRCVSICLAHAPACLRPRALPTCVPACLPD